MAVGTNLHMDLFLGTLRLEGRPTSALDHCIKNFRVDIFLHLETSNFLFYRFFSLFQLFYFKFNEGLSVTVDERSTIRKSLLIH